jgi:hypothetical protein
MGKKLIEFISLANLCFLPGWVELFRFRADAPGDMGSPAAKALFAATLLNVAALSIALFLGERAVRWCDTKIVTRIGECIFLLMVATGVDWLSWQVVCWGVRVGYPKPPLYFGWILLVAVPLVGCSVVLVWGKDDFIRVFRQFLRLSSPLPILFVGTFVWTFIHAEPWPVHAKMAQRSPSIPKRRLVWLVFDEWDQRLTFEVRPASIQCPNIDNLIEESIFCSKAQSPAPDTPESIMSLLSGIPVSKVSELSAHKSLLRLSSGADVSLQTSPNIFRDTRVMGINNGVVGWSLPYCSIFNTDLNECWCPSLADVKGQDYRQLILGQWRDEVRLNWMAAWFGSALFHRNPAVAAAINSRDEVIRAYLLMMKKSTDMVRDKSLALVFIHLLVPHPPGIWDRNKRKFTSEFSSNYIDNIELVDRTVGDFRDALKESGLDDRTTLIVSSDHPFRPDDWEKNTTWTAEEAKLTAGRRWPFIPFIVHMPNERNSLLVDAPINTIITKDLILNILGCGPGTQITDSEDVLKYLGILR